MLSIRSENIFSLNTYWMWLPPGVRRPHHWVNNNIVVVYIGQSPLSDGDFVIPTWMNLKPLNAAFPNYIIYQTQPRWMIMDSCFTFRFMSSIVSSKYTIVSSDWSGEATYFIAVTHEGAWYIWACVFCVMAVNYQATEDCSTICIIIQTGRVFTLYTRAYHNLVQHQIADRF